MHAVAVAAVAVAVGALSGCASEYHPEYHPQTATSYQQIVSYGTTVLAAGGVAPSEHHEHGHHHDDEGEGATAFQGDSSRVLVLQSTHLDRPAEVIGVVDAHVPMGSHEKALDVVKRRAAAMGADAVVGGEFHHGEGEGEPTHLSGLAVRFLPSVPYPIDH
jgi:hypothetical protein